jgi:hypothetical protein
MSVPSPKILSAQRSTAESLKYIRVRMDALQWELEIALKKGVQVGDFSRASVEMHSWANKLREAADALGEGLNDD